MPKFMKVRFHFGKGYHVKSFTFVLKTTLLFSNMDKYLELKDLLTF